MVGRVKHVCMCVCVCVRLSQQTKHRQRFGLILELGQLLFRLRNHKGRAGPRQQGSRVKRARVCVCMCVFVFVCVWLPEYACDRAAENSKNSAKTSKATPHLLACLVWICPFRCSQAPFEVFDFHEAFKHCRKRTPTQATARGKR